MLGYWVVLVEDYAERSLKDRICGIILLCCIRESRDFHRPDIRIGRTRQPE